MDEPAIETHDLHMHYGRARRRCAPRRRRPRHRGRGRDGRDHGTVGFRQEHLLHLVGALESPTSGTVAVAGRHYEGLGDKELTELRRDHIGFVFQFFNLLPSLTAEENVTLPAVIAKRHDALDPRARTHAAEARRARGSDGSPAGRAVGRAAAARLHRSRTAPLTRARAGGRAHGEPRQQGQPRCASCPTRAQRGGGSHDRDGDPRPAAAATADRVVFLRDGKVAGEVEGGLGAPCRRIPRLAAARRRAGGA